MNLNDLRQGLLNFSAAFYFHLFEQQLFWFHRKELLQPDEESNHHLYKLREVKARLRTHSIDVESFRSWRKIDELRLVANVVKHGEGDSAQGLREIRPEMFVISDLREEKIIDSVSALPPLLVQPLYGMDFFVSVEDLRTYAQAVVDFWAELADVLEQQSG